MLSCLPFNLLSITQPSTQRDMAIFDGIVEGLPNISGNEDYAETQVQTQVHCPTAFNAKPFNGTRAAFACILHMHQPLIPAGGEELQKAEIISNLQFMME